MSQENVEIVRRVPERLAPQTCPQRGPVFQESWRCGVRLGRAGRSGVRVSQATGFAGQRRCSTILRASLGETYRAPASKPATLVVPLWYRLLRPICPDRWCRGTMGMLGTLTDGSTPESARLGAERSLVQIQSPRLFAGMKPV
jgi:hypothetical protein